MTRRKIKTSISSHDYCFVCRRKRSERIRPIKINLKAIIHIYKKLKILIKEDSRCCKNHLNDHGLIKEECFPQIGTSLKSYKNQLISMLDNLYPKEKSVFEKFDDIEMLEESHCLEITGWSKDQLIKFSEFITSINDNMNRNKIQLIALYRYWLRTGTNQSVLAKLFNSTTTQQDISNYLSQIRVAINNDFVPFFLGSNNSREFFIKHNNEMVKELLQLENDELVIICDGTYKHIEKSSNNEMQYRTWSVQKSASLFKPFIICCADGYIIDCYGDFDANMNDAEILRYILKNDTQLGTKILLPDKTIIFLDRGFRDLIKFLREDLKFSAKIPTCQQLEEDIDSDEIKLKSKQLTVRQAHETRIVTKCRFIIEKKIGEIKKFASLKIARNRELGHLQIDYRIACAMINYTHKPCCPDKKNVNKIAECIRKKSENQRNELDFLLGKQLDTKLIVPIEISSIWDFPVLKKYEMKNKIFFGSYQLNQARSYVKDIISSKYCYIVTQKLLNKIANENNRLDFQQSKILAFEIISRHRRSKKRQIETETQDYSKQFKNIYKVFIQYRPGINKINSLQAYICTCLSGQKTTGCCSHVAAVIYYLSYFKYRAPGLLLRGEYLNKIPIDIQKNQPPNRPKIVHAKRNVKEDSSDSDLSSTDSESESNTVTNCLRRKSNKHDSNNKNIDENLIQDIIKLKKNLPIWGATIEYLGRKNVFVSNTCTIDYFLLGFWFLSQKNHNFLSNVINDTISLLLNKIVEKIELKEWNKAREIWINEMMKDNQQPKIMKDNSEITMAGSEKERFFNYLSNYQKHKINQKCIENCSSNNKVLNEDSKEIFFYNVDSKVILNKSNSKTCTECNSLISCEIDFEITPKFIFVQSKKKNIFIQDLPEKIKIKNENYILLFATVYKPGHFVGLFRLNGKLCVVDNLYQTAKILDNYEKDSKKKKENYYYNKVNISSCLYFLEE